MDSARFYRISGPSVWAVAPKYWSFSSLQSFEECPRRWQLSNSSYGEELPRFPRRLHQQTVLGTISHMMLDRMFRALALSGLPPPGSSLFRSVLARIDLLGSIRKALVEYEQEIAMHPRGAGFRLRFSERDVYNQVCKLFQPEYAKAQEKITSDEHPSSAESPEVSFHSSDGWLSLLCDRKILTEVPLGHPQLPLRGVVDLIVRTSGTTRIIDFKTGEVKAEHRAQVYLYALLWYRETAEVPSTVEIRYPTTRSVFSITRSELDKLEVTLAKRIEATAQTLSKTPADAVTGTHCRLCDVRQYCDDYWRQLPPIVIDRQGRPHLRTGWLDIELLTTSQGTEHGITTKTLSGVEIPVVFDTDGNLLHGPFVSGERLRIINASVTQKDALHLVRTTEVFHLTACTR